MSTEKTRKKDPAAVALGRRGGKMSVLLVGKEGLRERTTKASHAFLKKRGLTTKAKRSAYFSALRKGALKKAKAKPDLSTEKSLTPKR